MPTRSTTVEFGRKLETTPQTAATLVAGDYGYKIFDPSITLNADPVQVSPAGNHTRLLQTVRGMMTADVAFKEEVVGGAADGTAPAFYDLLKAAGFTVSTDVATLGPTPSNASSLTCMMFDGITETTAFGVRGTVELSAGSVSERLMCAFAGKGHGIEADQSAWPSGVSDITTAGAILDACTLTLGGFSPEFRDFRFRTEGDPVLIDSAGASDGLIEPILADTQVRLIVNVWQHTKAARDWLAYLRGTSVNQHALIFKIPLNATLELLLTGSLAMVKKPQRAAVNNVGTYPLEFMFDRTADIVFTQQLKS